MKTIISKSRLALAFLSACCVQLGTSSVQAQGTWKPTRPVIIVVPFSPGGGIDATARAAAKQLSVIWGQSVVVENLPGADGVIGARRVIDSKQDGHTLLIQAPSLLLTKYTPDFSGPDPVTRLEPISIISKASNAIVISGKLGAKTLPEFIQYCRTSATPCSFATGDVTGKFFSQKLIVEAGIPNAILVNYKGGGALLADLMSNVVNVGFSGLYPTLPHHKRGTLKIMATTGLKRTSAVPDIPTALEAGLTEYISENWVALFASKGTPPNIINGVADAVQEAVRDPETVKAIMGLSAEPIGSTTAAFNTQLQDEVQRIAVMAKKYPLN